jgi:hypothetical protein
MIENWAKGPTFHTHNQKVSHNASNVRGCPRLPSSSDFGHPLIFWLVPVWEAVQVQKKGVLFYLGRVPSYFFFATEIFIGRYNHRGI